MIKNKKKIKKAIKKYVLRHHYKKLIIIATYHNDKEIQMKYFVSSLITMGSL